MQTGFFVSFQSRTVKLGFRHRKESANIVRNILIVAFGGSIGAVLRYLISGWVQNFFNAGSFPAGTAVVNILGCLLIGLLGGWTENFHTFGMHMRLFLFLGVLGGFTTFSTFGYETMALLRDGQMLSALANIGINLFFGLTAVWLGYGLSSVS